MTREERVEWIGKELTRLAENSLDDKPLLESWLLPFAQNAPMVIICPGGAYGRTSPRESEPVARAYNRLGCHALVLHYRVAPHRFPEALEDVSRTVALVRTYAAELGVIPDKIALCGFSAGGHLTACLGVHWDKDLLQKDCCTRKGLNRPDSLILSYPVITGGEAHCHGGSYENLLGEKKEGELRDFLSLEKHVTSATPPTFLWHTQEDSAVPVENSFLFALALQNAGVTMEMHIYPYGAHGASLAVPETDDGETCYTDSHLATWLELSGQWLADLFGR